MRALLIKLKINQNSALEKQLALLVLWELALAPVAVWMYCSRNRNPFICYCWW